MEGMNTLTKLSGFVRRGRWICMGCPLKNGGSMFNLFLDHLQTLRSTLELSGLMGESWVFIYQTEAI